MVLSPVKRLIPSLVESLMGGKKRKYDHDQDMTTPEDKIFRKIAILFYHFGLHVLIDIT